MKYFSSLSKAWLVLFFSIIISCNASAQTNTDRIFSDTSFTHAILCNVSLPAGGFAGCGNLVEYPLRSGIIVRVDSAHHFAWAKKYSKGITASKLSLLDMIQLNDNGFISLCYIEDSVSSTSFSITMAVLRTDSSGNLIYVKSIADSAFAFSNNAIKMVAISDTTYYIVSNLAGSSGAISLCKMHIDGTFMKAKYFNFEPGNHTDHVRSVVKLMNGTFLVTGNQSVSWGNTSMLTFFCFDDDANSLWYKGYYEPSKPFTALKVMQSADSSILAGGIAGYAPGYPFAVKLTRQAILYGIGFTALAFTDNGYLAGGYDPYILPTVPYILKLDTAGAIVTSETYSHFDSPEYYTNDIEVLGDSVYLYFNFNAAPYGYGSGISVIDTSMTSNCSNDLITFADSALTLQTESYMSTYNEVMVISDMTIQYSVSSIMLSEGALCVTTTVEENSLANDASVFPNPMTDVVTVSLKSYDDWELSITDITGKIVYASQIKRQYAHTASVAHLACGIYFLKITQGQQQLVVKGVKM